MELIFLVHKMLKEFQLLFYVILNLLTPAGIADVLAKYLISMGIIVCSSDENAHMRWSDLSVQPSDYKDEHAADFLELYDLRKSTCALNYFKMTENLTSKNSLEQAYYISCCCASLNEISNQIKFLRYTSKLSDTKQLPVTHTFASIKEANLDVSTLLSLVSNLTNGCGTFKYSSKVLNDHAAQEKDNPVLPFLNFFLKEKVLIACETAISSFNEIVKIIAGPKEKKRADALLKRITIVKDSPSERCLALQTSSKIRRRAIVIFGTGDQRQAVTVTSNSGFIRAARQSGVDITAFEHQARALTENKEIL